MSEPVNQEPVVPQEAVTEPITPPPASTAGAMLREAREAAGLHIATLAVSLKVPVRKLEALESDRLDQLPDAVFVRALASSVCRTLKLDPAPILARLPQTTAPRLTHDDGGINAPFRAPSDAPGVSWLDQLSKPVFLAVFALLLGALVLIFLPTAQRGEAAQTHADSTAAPAAVIAAPQPPLGSPAQVAPGTTVAVSPILASTQVPTPSLSATFSVAVSTPTVISPTAVVTPSVSMAKATTATQSASSTLTVLPPSLSGAGLVVFKTRGESWVEVVDAKGDVALRKTMAKGEVVGASGALPLNIIIGRADVTDVQVRGKAFDLSAVARDNVARFEVK